MKKLLFALLATSTLLFSCGESDNSSEIPTREPIEVSSENWEDVLFAHIDNANTSFENIIDIQESGIDATELNSELDKVITKMNDLIAETNAHQITGSNAKKLTGPANNTKTKAIDFYRAIISYCDIAKENADFLLKKEWSDAENDKFDEIILPIEDNVYFAMDEFDNASSDFYEALDAL